MREIHWFFGSLVVANIVFIIYWGWTHSLLPGVFQVISGTAIADMWMYGFLAEREKENERGGFG
jgi:hypothetical protein